MCLLMFSSVASWHMHVNLSEDFFFSIFNDCNFILLGALISGPLLIAKALQLFPHIYLDEKDSACFKAGTGWLKRFKDRHGVHCLSIQGESL